MEEDLLSVSTATDLNTELEPMTSKSSGPKGNEKEEDGYIHMNPKDTRVAEPPDMVRMK